MKHKRANWHGSMLLAVALAAICIAIVGCNPTPAPAVPCCQVINVVPPSEVVGRDIKTGRTFEFQIGPIDYALFDSGAAIKVGDSLSADLTTGKITAINGVTKSYNAFEPNWGEPCCQIISIQPNPAVPCCEVVNAKNNATSATFQFKAEGEQLVKSLSVSQAVSTIGNWAAVQSSAIPGLGNKPATYSFAIGTLK